MRISIFGLGYVGAVSAGCLAQEGHSVIGVDPYQPKVDLINAGNTPVIEADIGDIVTKAAAAGTLRATMDIQDAVNNTEMSFICVGTPSLHNGALDLRYVRNVCEQIGSVIKRKEEFHVVVARSTMLPGSMRDVVIPALEEASGKKGRVRIWGV